MKQFLVKTRLALASILGPFEVHLLKFTLDTHPGSLMHYLGLLEFPVRICDALHITTHETYLMYPMSMIVISSLDFFCSRAYMYVYGMRYLTSRST